MCWWRVFVIVYAIPVTSPRPSTEVARVCFRHFYEGASIVVMSELRIIVLVERNL